MVYSQVEKREACLNSAALWTTRTKASCTTSSAAERAPELAQREVVERRLMTAHEQRERGPIAALEADHQRFVRDFAA